MLKRILPMIGLAAIGGAAAYGVYARRADTRKVHQEIERFAREAAGISTRPIGEDDLHDLPAPVQRYLRYAGVVGRNTAGFGWLRHSGAIRAAPGQPWMPLEGEEYFLTHRPAFLWRAHAGNNPFLAITARDIYDSGVSNMLIKFQGALTIGDSSGYELAQGALLRYAAELPWLPTAFLSLPQFHWQPIDDYAARATIADTGISGEIIFHFDDEGRIIKTEGPQRYRSVGKDFVATPFVGYPRQYREVQGLRVPFEMEAGWQLPEGYFDYFRAQISAIGFDLPARLRDLPPLA